MPIWKSNYSTNLSGSFPFCEPWYVFNFDIIYFWPNELNSWRSDKYKLKAIVNIIEVVSFSYKKDKIWVYFCGKAAKISGKYDKKESDTLYYFINSINMMPLLPLLAFLWPKSIDCNNYNIVSFWAYGPNWSNI